jgi:hypothetical protein
MPTRALPLLREARSAISLKPPDCPRKFAANSNKTRCAHASMHSNREPFERTSLNSAALKTAWKSSSIRTPAPQASGSPAPSILAANVSCLYGGRDLVGGGFQFCKKESPQKKKAGSRPAFSQLLFYADVYIFNANVFFLISEVI